MVVEKNVITLTEEERKILNEAKIVLREISLKAWNMDNAENLTEILTDGHVSWDLSDARFLKSMLKEFSKSTTLMVR